MTLYYGMVFALLVLEMAVFVVLILPFPFTWRRAMLRWVSQSFLVAKLQYTLKIVFIFVFILFLDSLNRTYRVEQENKSSETHLHDARTDAAFAAKKFYNQRNMYLTGFTLFLSLILNRTYGLILDLLQNEEQLEAIKKQAANQSKEHMRSSEVELQLKREVESLTNDLEKERKKTRDFDTIKKQAGQQADEYMRLADINNEMEKQIGNRAGEDKKSA